MQAIEYKRRAALLATVAAFSLIANASIAQEVTLDTAAAEETEEDEDVATPRSGDVVTVTGSRLRRDEFTSTAPIQVITAEAATLEGMIETADILQGSSVAAGSVQFNNRFGGFVIEGGTGTRPISLRGLGGQRTLVLLNNRRPGPSGVQGQVGAFDAGMIPESIIQRYEILKDGASTIYGSDAVAGVVNLITRTSIEAPEVTAKVSIPFDGGGEAYTVSGAWGANFDRGNLVFASEYQERKPIALADRDYFSCMQDLITDGNGNNIDREDRSIIGGLPYGGCENMYHNTVVDAFTGTRYIPAPDGVTIGGLDGYRPRMNGTYANGGQAYYEDVLFFPRGNDEFIQDSNKRLSLYGSSDFQFDILGGIDWRTEVLYTWRETEHEGWRQFFPYVGDEDYAPFGYAYANDPTYNNPINSVAQPVMPFRSNGDARVKYYTISSGLAGDFGGAGFFDDWGWTLDGVYSKSEGRYGRDVIIGSLSGDILYGPDAPLVDYFDPGFLNGDRADELYDAVGGYTEGRTDYEQLVVTAAVTGELFTLPAGAVGIALGAEYREFSIDDQPDPLTIEGDVWNSSTALVTKGEDSVTEAFAEIEVPILAGMPMFEELTFNASGRIFDYESYGSDGVWKVGGNWQIIPAVRLRATHGTSYRAPALYELFLGDQTGFQSQTAIDPCIDWGNSSNENVRANCAAAGIPADYTGGASSATVISGGGAGVLEAETSEATTFGVIFTPTFADINIAIDYFKIEVEDEVSRLGASSILGGCYGAPNYPNAFCELFDRGMPGSPYAITEVRDSYLNVNNQETEGFDITVRYEKEFNFGNFLMEAQSTITTTDIVNLFDPEVASGFDSDDYNGTIGDPEVVANVRFALERGDFTYSWFVDYVGETDNSRYYDETFTYFGFANAHRDVGVPETFFHSASVRWEGETLTVIAGINNIFDQEPPTVSDGATPYRLGNVPYLGTQYPFEGQTGFLTVSKTF